MERGMWLTLAVLVGCGGNGAFDVTFNPSASGVRNATISIPNNNPLDNNYTFAIRGTGVSSIGGSPGPNAAPSGNALFSTGTPPTLTRRDAMWSALRIGHEETASDAD